MLRGIAEFSIYLERNARGRGIGRRLLSALVDAARSRGYWKARIPDLSQNAASRAICKACGFREVGVYEGHGRLDGQWLDTVMVNVIFARISRPDRQPRSTAIIDLRSRMYSRVPTSTGGVHDKCVSSGAFAAILNPCGEGCAIIRLPS